MNDILDNLNEKLKNLSQEIYLNHNFGIICSNIDTKSELKQHLPAQSHEYPCTYIEINVNNSDISLNITNDSIFIYGEYQKLSREISQSKFSKLRSVADFTISLKIFFKCKKITFIGLGKEDSDVMMVGFRPFLLEIINPQKNLNFEHLDFKLYKEVNLRNIKQVNKNVKMYFHNSQFDKSKLYRALIYCNNARQIECPVTFHLKQQTPLRVLHRRANLTRERVLTILESENQKEFLELKILAEAGTYIKEFVNGDFKRTNPSLTEIFKEYADCLQLDVLEIQDFSLPKEMIIKEIDFSIEKI